MKDWQHQVQSQDRESRTPAAHVMIPFMQALHEPSYRAGLEAAARQCDKLARGMEGSGQADGAMYLAKAIRALAKEVE